MQTRGKDASAFNDNQSHDYTIMQPLLLFEELLRT